MEFRYVSDSSRGARLESTSMASPMKTVARLLSAAKDLCLGTNLASLGLIGRPRAMHRYAREALLLRRSVAPSRLQSRTISEVLPSARDVHLQLFPNRDNWFVWGPSFSLDIVSLCILCRSFDQKRIFEIGTFHGYTTLHLAMNSADDAVVYTLDLAADSDVSLNITDLDRQIIAERQDACCFAGHHERKKIHRLFGDSAKFDFSPFTGKIDLFFIDGAHSYEYVKSDTLNALKCCHRGSAIAWHDYGRVQFGVTRFLEELAKQMEIYIVPGGSLAFAILK